MPRQGMVFTRPILPESVQEDRVRLNVLNELGKIARAIRRDFNRTTATWEHHVSFTPGKVFSRGTRGREAEYGVSVVTTDLVWGFLNEGTDVRRRGLTVGYEPKTIPDTFESFEGFGTVVGWGVYPGIPARNWTLLAERTYERPLLIAVTNAILAGLENQRLPGRGR